MNDQTTFDAATRIAAGDDGTTYDRVAIALHWATAFLVIANFALSQVWDWFAKPTKGLLEDTHMSFGVLLTVVVIARIAWRLIPGHQVSSIEAGWMRLASKTTHYVLDALLIAEAALGFTFRWGAGRPMAFLFTEIDFFIVSVYRNSKPRGSANFRPGSNPSHRRS